MPVLTRRQANQLREDEFAVLRMIEMDYVYDNSFCVKVTSTSRGCNTHTRWYYSDDSLSHIDDIDEPSEGTPESSRLQDQTASLLSTEPSSSTSEEYQDRTPESSPPKTPTHRSRRSPEETRVLADADMEFVLHIKKDEDVREALERHIEMYVKESTIRQRENKRRVYEYVKSRPQILRELDTDTDVIVRHDPVWGEDPFL